MDNDIFMFLLVSQQKSQRYRMFLVIIYDDKTLDTNGLTQLTHCILTTPYSDMDLGQNGPCNGLLRDGTKPLPEADVLNM